MRKLLAIAALLCAGISIPLAACAQVGPAEKRLNNLVVELLNRKSLPTIEYQEISFTNPYDGWVFFQSTTRAGGNGEIRISVDSVPRENALIVSSGQNAGRVQEAMRYLPKGKHALKIWREGSSTLEGVVVRSIPELHYAQYGANPHVTQYGLYDWDFLKKHVLMNVNVLMADASVLEIGMPHVREWKRQGKKWIFHAGAPGWTKADVPIEESYRYWLDNPGFQHPLADGIIVDEWSGASDKPEYLQWAEAIDRVCADPKTRDKRFYAYINIRQNPAAERLVYPEGYGWYTGTTTKVMAETIMDRGGILAEEWYFLERPTLEESMAKEFMQMRDEAAGWEKARPGSLRHILLAPGYMSQPFESLNIDPTVDFKVFLDEMMYLFANDPAFEGLYGLQHYLSSYADEETVRWVSRLYRHYCIDGRKNLLSAELGFKFRLDHILNPDFTQGLDGWSVSPAEEGSVTAGSLKGWGFLQGRYTRAGEGDAFLLMRRSDEKPNIVTQQIRNLKPGKLYSLKMFTADHEDIKNDISNNASAKLSITIDGVEIIEDNCFDQLIHNCYSHELGKFNATHKAWMYYSWRVFRANGTTANLTLSDWVGDSSPGGRVGQEIMCNFIEIQPYFAE